MFFFTCFFLAIEGEGKEKKGGGKKKFSFSLLNG